MKITEIDGIHCPYCVRNIDYLTFEERVNHRNQCYVKCLDTAFILSKGTVKNKKRVPNLLKEDVRNFI